MALSRRSRGRERGIARRPLRCDERGHRGMHEEHAVKPSSETPQAVPGAVIDAPYVDPVCQMKVDPLAPKGGTHTHAGKRYGFCNPKCQAKFAAEPEKYLNRPPAPMQPGTPAHGEHAHPGVTVAPPAVQLGVPASAGTAYVCPMDPEV